MSLVHQDDQAVFRMIEDDEEFARYLRNRARDLLSDDYESGDAAWVTGHAGRVAVSTVALLTAAALAVRNGPPEAVRITRRTSSRRLPLMAWNTPS